MRSERSFETLPVIRQAGIGKLQVNWCVREREGSGFAKGLSRGPDGHQRACLYWLASKGNGWSHTHTWFRAVYIFKDVECHESLVRCWPKIKGGRLSSVPLLCGG